MGLMQSAEEELVIGRSVSYCFLHLTLQEYLAALHWSRMGSEDMVRLVSNPLECFVTAWCVANSSPTSRWSLRFEDLSMLPLASSLLSVNGLTKLTSVPVELLKIIITCSS